MPVAAVSRQGRVITVAESKAPALEPQTGDHDYHKFAIIPSVNQILVPPEDPAESFYRGGVFIGLKDQALQPSSSYRHDTELIDSLKKYHNQSVPPIVLKYTDGGPDRKCNNAAVILSNIALCYQLDLDFLVHARTAPGDSFKNPAERLMSILNLSLQGVSLCRESMDKHHEEKIKKASTMKAVRALCSSDDALRVAVLQRYVTYTRL